MDFNDISFLTREFQDCCVHYHSEQVSRSVGSINLKEQKDIYNNELETIYHLSEQHAINLRLQTSLKWQRSDRNEENNISIISIKCPKADCTEDVKQFARQIEAMPKEWTLVQLTGQKDPEDAFIYGNNKYTTPALYISVISCGEGKNPYCVPANYPIDSVNRTKINVIEEIQNIIKKSKQTMQMSNAIVVKTAQKRMQEIIAVQDRLSSIIQVIQNLWLKHWRCLLVGKLANQKVEQKILTEIVNFYKTQLPETELSEKNKHILLSAVKCSGYGYLKKDEIKNILLYCFPNVDKTVIKNSLTFFMDLYDNHKLKTARKNPLILILDDCLDVVPWEMIDVLQGEPVTRLPSFHFLQVLFQEYKDDIKDGFKIITDYKKGTYVVNPDADLLSMETRIMNFFNYWCPNWTGTSGYKPSNDEFYELITSSCIFSYNGHGNGSHLMTTERLQETVVKAVVLLFGCGSAKIERLDPQIGYHAKYYTYLMAKCPCVVGMLWEVTDIDTDVLTTEFLSQWIPSENSVHWKHVNKKKWKMADISMKFSLDETLVSGTVSLEPELSKALSLAKQNAKYVITKSACVVRGLPMKIEKTY